MRRIIPGLLLLAALGCSADPPDQRDPVGEEDPTPTPAALGAPEVDPPPSATPNATVALRGKTTGNRIVVTSPGGNVVVPVLPTGDFCIDVPLADGAPTALSVVALGDGLVSPPVPFEVTRSASAAPPPSAMCSNETEAACVAAETCGNDKDDDCNGLADECDSSCNGCQDDVLEPNDRPAAVPTVARGTYPLSLCPCREDWFAFHVAQGQHIHVRTTFTHSQIDLDLKLFRAADAETGAPVATSVTINDFEEIDWAADQAGTYYLHAYPYVDKPGSYSLTIY